MGLGKKMKSTNKKGLSVEIALLVRPRQQSPFFGAAHAGDVRASSRTSAGDEEGRMRSSGGVSGPALATGVACKMMGATGTWVLGRASGNVRGMTRTGLSGTGALRSTAESRSRKKTMRESLDNDNITTQIQFWASAGREERR